MTQHRIVLSCGPGEEPGEEQFDGGTVQRIRTDLLSIYRNLYHIQNADTVILIANAKGAGTFSSFLGFAEPDKDRETLCVECGLLTAEELQKRKLAALSPHYESEVKRGSMTAKAARERIAAALKNPVDMLDRLLLQSAFQGLGGFKTQDEVWARSVLQQMFVTGTCCKGRARNVIVVMDCRADNWPGEKNALGGTTTGAGALRYLLYGDGKPRRSVVESHDSGHKLFASLARLLDPPAGTSFDILPAANSLFTARLGSGAQYRRLRGRTGKPVGFEAHNGGLHVAFLDTAGQRYDAAKLLQIRETCFKDRGYPVSLLVDLEDCRECRQKVEHLLRKRGHTNPLVGESPAILRMYPVILRVIENPKRIVMVYGEVGSGKEVLTELLARSDPPGEKLVSEEVTTLLSGDEAVMSGRLFGNVEGFATGVRASSGLISDAGKGTFVLDGMEGATETLQRALRRVFESETRRYRAVGAKEEKTAECRLVGLFNLRPEDLIEKGLLLRDYRGRFEVKIRIPSLRSRPGDVPLLVRALAERHLKTTGQTDLLAHIDELMPPPTVIEEWQSPDWPGALDNVRGLFNEVKEHLDKAISVARKALRESAARQGAAKGGRPKGSKKISDQDLVEILRRAVQPESGRTMDTVFAEIHAKTPGKKTTHSYGSLSVRIHRIGKETLPKPEVKKLWEQVKKIPGFGKLPRRAAG